MTQRPILSLRLDKLGEQSPIAKRLQVEVLPEVTPAFNEAAPEPEPRHPLLDCVDQAKAIRDKSQSVDYFGTFIDDAINDEDLTIKDKSCIIMAYTGRLTDLDDFETAVKYAEIACNIDGTDIKSMTRLATIQKHLGRYEDAKASYMKALDIDYKDKYALTGLGGLYEAMDLNDKAAECYNLALKFHPRDGMASVRLSQLDCL